MKTIDELVHDAEVEADVLRAVSHMPSSAAQEFLLNVALKIRRASDGPSLVTPPDSVETPPDPSISSLQIEGTPSIYDRNRTAEVLAFLEANGASTTNDVKYGCQRFDDAQERNRVGATIGRLQQSGQIRRTPYGRLELTCQPIPKVVGT